MSELKLILKEDLIENVDFSEKDLNDYDFSFKTITNCNFDNTNLKDINFKGANLKDSTFCGAYLANVSFENANLYGADFYYACFEEVNMTKAELNNVHIEGLTGAEVIKIINYSNAEQRVDPITYWGEVDRLIVGDSYQSSLADALLYFKDDANIMEILKFIKKMI